MGAGFCSLYHEIHYIKVRYIEVRVYILYYLLEPNYVYSTQSKVLLTYKPSQSIDRNAKMCNLSSPILIRYAIVNCDICNVI